MKTRSGKIILTPYGPNKTKRKVASSSRKTRKRDSYSTVASKVSKQLNIPFRTKAMRHPLTKHLHSRDINKANQVYIVPKPRTKQIPNWDDSSNDTSIPSTPPPLERVLSKIAQTPYKPETRKRVKQFMIAKPAPSSKDDDWWDL